MRINKFFLFLESNSIKLKYLISSFKYNQRYLVHLNNIIHKLIYIKSCLEYKIS